MLQLFSRRGTSDVDVGYFKNVVHCGGSFFVLKRSNGELKSKQLAVKCGFHRKYTITEE
jgi:hypothetical protein